jgi:hypothetical protein
MDAARLIQSKVTIAVRREASILNATYISVLAICIVVISYFSIFHYRSNWYLLNGLHDYKVTLEGQAELGRYIESNIEEASIFLASYENMNYLPGLSSKAKVVFFRSSIFTPYPVNRADLEGVLSSDESFSIKQRMDFISKHNIQYILIKNASVEEYYAAYPQFFTSQKFGEYWLIEYIEDLTYIE